MTDKKKPLSKSDFAKIIKDCGNYKTQKEAEKALSAFTDAVQKTLKGGDNISLIGFGNFEVKARPARQGRNPRTGDTMTIKATNHITSRALTKPINFTSALSGKLM